MIRPFTLICMASAFGAGLYLYQTKHTAQLLDREIARTIKQTDAVRDRTGMLRAEWALLNEPDRLADLARAHLTLQTLKPTQFVAMNDLASRLPAPVAPHPERLPVEAEPEEPVAVPVAQVAPVVAPAAAPVAAPGPVAVAAAKPKNEAKPEAKVAEAKPVTRVAEKTPEKVERAERAERAPVERVVARSEPVHARAYVPPASASNEATAPGTVGAAVMRAMREQERPAAMPARAYAPPYTPPTYAQPAYAQPASASPGYATPAASVLGGHPALPPPVPFAAR